MLTRAMATTPANMPDPRMDSHRDQVNDAEADRGKDTGRNAVRPGDQLDNSSEHESLASSHIFDGKRVKATASIPAVANRRVCA